MLIVLLVPAALVGFWWVRRRLRRRMVAGLDRPAVWREPAPGRVGSRKGELL